MPSDADLEAEQAYLDQAYDALEASRRSASRLAGMVEVGRGGTNQARYEREVIHDSIVTRLTQLHIGDAALVFGRIDRDAEHGGDRFHIGRVAVSDADYNPLVVDWRAPVAEPFYRATGRNPMGLHRRRHFATRGRKLLAMEGVDLEFRDDAIKEIIVRAKARKTGARALRGVVEEAMLEVMYALPDRENLKKVVMTAETISRTGEPIYSYGEEQQRKTGSL